MHLYFPRFLPLPIYWCAVCRASKPALQQYDLLMSKPVAEAVEAVKLAAGKVNKQWRTVSHIMHKEADQLAAKALSEQVRHWTRNATRSVEQPRPEVVVCRVFHYSVA